MKVVYEHWLDNKCVYVGYGEPYRPYSTHRSSIYWDVVQNRFNEVDVRIIKEFEDKEEAKQFEIKWSIKRRKEGHPIIGYIGNHPTEIHKEKLRNANKHKWTEEEKRLQSERVKQEWIDGKYDNRKIDYNKVSNSLKGHKISEETKKKISESLKRRSTK